MRTWGHEESHNTHHWLTSEVFSSGLVLGCVRVACRVIAGSLRATRCLPFEVAEGKVRSSYQTTCGGERLRSVVPGRGFVRPNCHGSPTLWPLQARRARGEEFKSVYSVTPLQRKAQTKSSVSKKD